jgi:hypothetical protein
MELKVADLYEQQFSRLVYLGFNHSGVCSKSFWTFNKDTVVGYAIFNLKVLLLWFKVTGTCCLWILLGAKMHSNWTWTKQWTILVMDYLFSCFRLI